MNFGTFFALLLLIAAVSGISWGIGYVIAWTTLALLGQ